MMNEIELHKLTINAICKQYHVAYMYAFGSVLSDKFQKESDIDLLVKFQPFELENYFNNYIGLKDALEKTFKRKVDLLEEQTLKNPILIKSIGRNKQLIYG